MGRHRLGRAARRARGLAVRSLLFPSRPVRVPLLLVLLSPRAEITGRDLVIFGPVVVLALALAAVLAARDARRRG